MKTLTTTLSITVLFLANSFNSYSQDVAMIEVDEKETSIQVVPKEEKSLNTLLKEGVYTYKLGSNDIKVVFKDNYYTEYHPNNEFIKAKVNWSSENEYTLTIVKIKKDNLPFKEGTELKTKITKVKGDKYYYESDLGSSTWDGKFKKVDESFFE